MTVGGANKKPIPQVAKCQKCLQSGHWTYECRGKRKIVVRESRTVMLNKRMKLAEEKLKFPNQSGANEILKPKKKKKEEASSDSGSDSDSSDSSSFSSGGSDSSTSSSSSSNDSSDD